MDISSLKSFSPEALFREVVRHNAEVGSTTAEGLVEVTVTLTSGVELSGRPVHVDGSKNATVSTGSGLAYFALGQLHVIEILDAAAAGSIVMRESASNEAPSKAPPPPPGAPVVPATSPPRSDLREEVTELNTVLSRKFSIEVLASVLDDPSFGDTGKNQFAEFLDILRHALFAIGEDPVGEITIQSLQQISIIQAAGQLAVDRSGPVMVVAVPFDEPFDSTLSARLQTELQLNM